MVNEGELQKERKEKGRFAGEVGKERELEKQSWRERLNEGERKRHPLR